MGRYAGDEFARIMTFIKVVEAGGFSAAARDLSSTSAMSRQVKSLEDELGVRLLNRNTRRIALTDAGRRFYERAAAIALELKQAKIEASSEGEEVRGTLRVALRVTAGTTIVVPALPRFLSQHPKLELDITLTDERRDLIASRFDVAMWLGDLPDSELVARRLCRTGRIVCGSPGYFEQHGIPKVPQDLRHHDCLLFTQPSYDNRWRFLRDGKEEIVEVKGRLKSENGLVLLSAGLASLGLNIVHRWMVRDLIAQGRMRTVLQDYIVHPRPGDADLFAVYPAGLRRSRKVRAFVDFLAELFREDDREATSSPTRR